MVKYDVSEMYMSVLHDPTKWNAILSRKHKLEIVNVSFAIEIWAFCESPSPLHASPWLKVPLQVYRLFIIDLMASTWSKDNQALFPVKKHTIECFCHCARHRETFVANGTRQSRYDWCFKTDSPVILQAVFCICANKQWSSSSSCYHWGIMPPLQIWLFRWGIWRLVFCLRFLFEFPFHFLLIWKTKLVIDVDDGRKVHRQKSPSSCHVRATLQHTGLLSDSLVLDPITI